MNFIKTLALSAIVFLMSNISFAQKTGTFYKIQNTKSNFFLATNGANNSNAPIVRKARVGKHGKWLFIKHRTKGYRIYNCGSGLFMASFGQTASGSIVKQTDAPGEGAYWRLVQTGNGLRIQNTKNGLYLANMGNPYGELETLKMTSSPGNGAFWIIIETK